MGALKIEQLTELLNPTPSDLLAIVQGTSPAKKISLVNLSKAIGSSTDTNVMAYGAKVDGQVVTDGAINSGSHTLNSASGLFSAADVGKYIEVDGAGAAGVVLVTTVSAYVSATQLTLTAAASTTVTGKRVLWGTDDSAALVSAVQSFGTVAHSKGCNIRIPSGILITAPVELYNRVRLWGAGRLATILYFKAGSNGHLIYNHKATDQHTGFNAQGCGVIGLTVQGNRFNQTSGDGIHWEMIPNWTQADNDDDFDANMFVFDVWVQYVHDIGYHTVGRAADWVIASAFYYCGLNGLKPGADNFIILTQAGQSGQHGWWLDAPNCHIEECTSFYSGAGAGTYAGYYITDGQGGIQMLGCIAQDNRGAGYWLSGTHGALLVGCTADSNSTSGDSAYSGYDLDGCDHCIIEGANAFERQAVAGKSYQKHGLYVHNTALQNRVSLMHFASDSGNGLATIGNPLDPLSVVSNNDVRINDQWGHQNGAWDGSNHYAPDIYAGGIIELPQMVNSTAYTLDPPLTSSNGHESTRVVLILQQSPAGTATLTWNGVWIMGTGNNIGTGAGKRNVFQFVKIDSSNWVLMGVAKDI